MFGLKLGHLGLGLWRSVAVPSEPVTLIPEKVQGALHQNGASSSTTVAVTLDAPVSSGGAVCVAVGFAGTYTTINVTDDKGNTYTQGNTDSGSYSLTSFYCTGITNAPQTITATMDGAHSFSTIIASEFSHVLESGALDGNALLYTPGVNTLDGITSNADTTTVDGCLIWGMCVNLSGNSTLAKGTGFTQDQISGDNFNTEYRIQDSAGSVAATWTGTSSDSFAAVMLALKPKVGTGGDPEGNIPLTWGDSRFSANVAGASGPFQSGTLSNKDWNDSPTYANGDQAFIWDGDGSDELTLSQVRIDWREGPRISTGSTPTATININESFIQTVGFAEDHADCIQAFSPGGLCILNITNSCIRSYSDAEAVNVFGAGAIGSGGIFWADDFQGEVHCTNVVFLGGARGCTINADTGTTRVSFENVYFVADPGGYGGSGYDLLIQETGGAIVVDKWINVRTATIVDGTIVPGASLPSP